MKPSQLIECIAFSIENNFNILVKGKPGVGKSDIAFQGFELWQHKYAKDGDFEIWHPVISDPTDFKGLPYAHQNGATVADFLPFRSLHRAMTATRKLVILIDDIGQAPSAVQAALMQPLLAREIGGKKISPFVSFISCTNRKEDKAAVSGLLEPVKSRFASIIELEVNTDDWVRWALGKGNMPTELIAFIRFRPELLDNFQPTKDIVNSPSPRTVAYVGKMMNAGIPQGMEFELFKGAAGEAFAAEFKGFLDIFNNLPNIDQIFLSPDSVDVPTQPAVLYAVSGALASRITDVNATNAFKYIKRLPAEIGVACVKDTVVRNPKITNTRSFIDWASVNGNILFN